MAELRTYNAKRDFSKTPEPRGAAAKGKGNQYVIQKHAATRLHYDLRLELEGVMLSWAVAKGPSLIPGEKRLAIHTEDHPIEYNKFEGTIPKGEYGGGTVMIWDRGRWFPEGDAHKSMKKGHLDFRLEGEKLQGRWHLVRMKQRPGERQEAWLLIKSDDEAARGTKDPDILEERSESVVSGRSIDEIAAANDKQWHSNRPPKSNKIFTEAPKPPPAAVAKSGAKTRSTTRARAAKAKPAAKTKAKPKVKEADFSGEAAAIPGARRAKLPDFVPPCLATLSSKAPDSADWVHEIKFDGYRIQAGIDGGKVSLKTRTGLDWTSKFPRIANACAELASHRVLIDGEVVSEKANGVSDFSGLQDDLKTGRHDRLAYYVFDLLYLDGYDLTGSPLLARKEALRKVLSGLPADTAIRLSEQFEEEGSLLLRHACDMGLEGIISKRRDAPFRSGRIGDWLKTKCTSSQELVVAGYEPSTAATRTIRSLVLGYYDNGEFRYAGRVGSGLSEKSEDDLVRRLKALQADKPPFVKLPPEEKGRKVKWVKPRLVIEVDFRGWTGSGLLRQASFKGVREDKPPEQVVKEMPKQIMQAAQPAAGTSTRTRSKLRVKPQAGPAKSSGKKGPEFSGVTLTNPDRVYWPDVGLTKLGLAEYYTAIWDWMAPHFIDRPLSLVRCPEGALTECFFQKHASAGLDAKYLRQLPEKGNQHFIAAEDLKGLMALVQAGTLEIHLWGTTADEIETCDRLVFDLDPGPEVTWAETIAGAREVRQRLADMGLETFLKTTGGKGLHVVVPIEPADWDTAKSFAHQLSLDMARDTPDKYTANMAKKVRTKRIYVDYLRNGRGATAIGAYSTRARPGATVSAPITWTELGKLEAPNIYTVLNLPQRLKRQRQDPWADIGRVKQRLPKAARPGK